MREPRPLPVPPDSLSFSVSDAVDAGISLRRLRGADLQHPYWGVRTPDHRELSIFQRCAAFGLRMPPGAFFSHATAAIAQRVPLPLRLEEDVTLDVGTMHTRRPVDAVGVRGHRMQIAPTEVMNWVGLQVTRPERTWFDLAALLTLPELVAAGDFLIHRRVPRTTKPRSTDRAALWG
ncbi:MAG TPA: hypothetical protein VIJ18_00340 [Microbacteriaceae bacterium]